MPGVQLSAVTRRLLPEGKWGPPPRIRGGLSTARCQLSPPRPHPGTRHRRHRGRRPDRRTDDYEDLHPGRCVVFTYRKEEEDEQGEKDSLPKQATPEESPHGGARPGPSTSAGPDFGFRCQRYTVTVLDALYGEEPKVRCCAMVVPIGGEEEWIYSSVGGQWQLLADAGTSRLIMIARQRSDQRGGPGRTAGGVEGGGGRGGGESFGEMRELSDEEVKAEVKRLVWALAPRKCFEEGAAICFISYSDNIIQRRVLEVAESPLLGEMVVEDVEVAEGESASEDEDGSANQKSLPTGNALSSDSQSMKEVPQSLPESIEGVQQGGSSARPSEEEGEVGQSRDAMSLPAAGAEGGEDAAPKRRPKTTTVFRRRLRFKRMPNLIQTEVPLVFGSSPPTAPTRFWSNGRPVLETVAGEGCVREGIAGSCSRGAEDGGLAAGGSAGHAELAGVAADVVTRGGLAAVPDDVAAQGGDNGGGSGNVTGLGTGVRRPGVLHGVRTEGELPGLALEGGGWVLGRDPAHPSHDRLVHKYLPPIVAGLVLASPALDACLRGGETPRVLVIGVGGGALPTFLRRHFPFHIQAVDLDEVVVEIARRHFGLVEDCRLAVTVADGAAMLSSLADDVVERGIASAELAHRWNSLRRKAARRAASKKRRRGSSSPSESSPFPSSSSEDVSASPGSSNYNSSNLSSCGDTSVDVSMSSDLSTSLSDSGSSGDTSDDSFTSGEYTSAQTTSISGDPGSNGGDPRCHVIAIDVDSGDASRGLYSPPMAFLHEEFLLAARIALAEGGMLAMNVVPWGRASYERVVACMRPVFPDLHETLVDGDVNRVVYGLASESKDMSHESGDRACDDKVDEGTGAVEKIVRSVVDEDLIERIKRL